MKTTESFLGFDFEEIELCEKQERGLEVGHEPPAARELALETMGKRHQYWTTELEAVKARNKIIRELMDADEAIIERKLEWYERNIVINLKPGPDSELVTDNVAMFYRQSERVITPTIDELPLEYTRVKQEADKEAIEAALKQGKAINGCAIEVRWNLQIKAGGIKAKEAAKRRAKQRDKKLLKPSHDNSCLKLEVQHEQLNAPEDRRSDE